MLGLFAVFYWNDLRDQQYHELNQDYHLASLKNIAVIKEEIQLIRLWRLTSGNYKNRATQPALQSQDDLNIVNVLVLISAAADALQDMQRRYAVPQFASLSVRVQKSLDIFRQTPIDDVLGVISYEAELEPILLQLQQFERLHLIVYEERVAAEAARKRRGKIVTIVAVSIILLVSITLIGYFLQQVRTALSRQRQAEAVLRNLNTELDQRVRKRTGELEDARDEAERANRAKSEFLSRMSHELRTPMNAVLGAAQLLEYTGDQLDSKQRRYVELIKSGGGHLLELINEVLDLARIESGNYELQLEPVSIGLLVQECIGLLGPIVKSRQLHLENHIDTDDDYISADPKCLRQVLLNLMSNAVKYNRDGGQIMIHCDRSTPGRFRLGVSDTGPGIDAADQARIFQPFDRLQTDTHVEGTGIGLAVSRQLVELMGGELTVDSRPGEGSTFWIELNADDAECNTSKHQTPSEAAAGHPPGTTMRYGA
jgi:signal transduction histidine kinase